MTEETAVAGAEVKQTADNSHELARSIDWKQGLVIAMGIPILILPSLYDLSGNLYAMSVAIWTISVLQGFLQNFAIGELAATFGVAGIGGCAQFVFQDDEKYKNSRVNWGRFIGAMGAWAYFETWLPVIPIFTIMIGTYLQNYVTIFAGVNSILLNLALGVLIYGSIILVGSKGLVGGARLQLVLAAITIVPMAVIVCIPFFTGGFNFSTVTSEWYPPSWDWKGDDICMLFGCLAVAQWSACGWESAATYGAEYKNPSKDIPKALIACGLMCLFMYFIVALAVFGTLGFDGIQTAGYATLMPIAEMDFGPIGGGIALILLIAGMYMIIQTAFLDCARTMFIMAHEGNMPRFFSRTNANGAPVYAMLFEFVVGLCMIPLNAPGMILAGSAIGFCFALGMAMLSFIKARRDPRFKDVKRTWRAPRGWLGVAIFVAILQFFVLIPGLVYYTLTVYDWFSLALGLSTLFIYVPLWFVIQWYNKKYPDKYVRTVKANKQE